MCSGQHRIYFVEIVLLRVLTPARKNPCSKASPFKLGLPLFVCIRFQDLFHSPPGVLFAFPSRYWFTIGRSRVFSLGGWSPHLQTGLHVSRPTFWYPQFHSRPFTYGAVTHCGRPFQSVPLSQKLKGTGCSHFARHYSGNLG